jgi:predicted GNAT family N-acyltransferase
MHETLSEVENRLLDQFMKSRRSIKTRINSQKHLQPASEHLGYAHFSNKHLAHGKRHKAALTYGTYRL